jgi:hypothetical protein
MLRLVFIMLRQILQIIILIDYFNFETKPQTF